MAFLPALGIALPLVRFRRSEHGFVFVFFAVCIPALLGIVGLAIDGTRLLTLDTQLAAMADAAALAAANQLDRSEDAIRAARNAGATMVNRASFADRSATGARLTFRFAARLSDLQRSQTFSLGDGAGASATYVEVTTAEASLTTSLLQLIGARIVPVRRRSIAESRYYACDVTPAMLCQPNPDAFVASARPGRQYLLRMDGNTVAGSIALLDWADADGPRQTLRSLASDAPKFCYADGVRLRTNVTPAEFDGALNIRFDRYVTRTGRVSPDLAIYPPAPNVIQGRHLNTCTSLPQGGEINPPYPLPRDSAYRGFRLTGPWDQGVGDWKSSAAIGGTGATVATALEEYLLWNHADKPSDLQDRLRGSRTRYELYLRELGLTSLTETDPVDTRSYGPSVMTMPTGGPNSGPFSLRKDSAVPVCYAGNRPAVEARRRIVYLSVADCGAFPSVATAADLSRIVGKFFLTEPSDLGATLLEFVDFIRPAADDGKLRHVVQLVTTD